jgi:hypothetical protein
LVWGGRGLEGYGRGGATERLLGEGWLGEGVCVVAGECNLAALGLALLQGAAHGDRLGRRLALSGAAGRVAARVRSRLDRACRLLVGAGRDSGAGWRGRGGCEGAEGCGARAARGTEAAAAAAAADGAGLEWGVGGRDSDGPDGFLRTCRHTAWTLVAVTRLLWVWARRSASRQVRLQTRLAVRGGRPRPCTGPAQGQRNEESEAGEARPAVRREP